MQRVLGALVLAEPRIEGEIAVTLGPRERALLDEMPWPLRRAEWLAGRHVAKQLLKVGLGLDPAIVEVLPLESGAPRLYLNGVAREDLVINLSHTKGWAVAAVATARVGVDVCDDVDGARIERIARRVFSDGEAERCGALLNLQTCAATWAMKEAGLKLFIGGVFDPGARAFASSPSSRPASPRSPR